MIFAKDHKTLDMFDPLARFGPHRRERLEKSWARLFREEILPELPVHKLRPFFSEKKGAPTKDPFAMLGIALLQQMHDLTDEETIDRVAVDVKWHFALNLSEGKAGDVYVCPKTLWTLRRLLSGNDLLKVSVNKRAGTVSISFASPSAEGSANIVKYFLDEGKSRLQEEALDRAIRNKKFIEEQIGKTVDALNRDRLYSLLGQEVEREMMGRNRDQFVFRVIDLPRAPDREIKPQRSQSAILAMVLSFFAGCVFFVVREKSGKNKFPPAVGNAEEINQ